MQIDIYKKRLNEIKKSNNKSDKWKKIFPVIGKDVFEEDIPELLKYKIMIWVYSFEYLIEDKGVYVFEVKHWPRDYKKYIDYYNGVVSVLKKVRIQFILNCGE